MAVCLVGLHGVILNPRHRPLPGGERGRLTITCTCGWMMFAEDMGRARYHAGAHERSQHAQHRGFDAAEHVVINTTRGFF